MIKVYVKSRDEYVFVDSSKKLTMELADRIVLRGHYNRRVFARADYRKKTEFFGIIESAFQRFTHFLTGYPYEITLDEALKWWDGKDFSEDYEAQLMKAERENERG